MLYSKLFPKTRRNAPSEEKSINAQLLIKAGFIDKLQSGVYSFLPLGHLVHEKIKDVVRENMNEVGGQEVFMPTLQPKELWEKTGRWDDKVIDVWYKTLSSDGREMGLATTHEEVISEIVSKNLASYRDLPLYIYQIQTKFRNEPRAQAGLLRGREFSMKDLYSFHTTEEDLSVYYEIVKGQYLATFKELGLSAVVTEASGCSFSKEYSHEFNVIAEVGENPIYVCPECDYSQHKELGVLKEGQKCPVCQSGEVKLVSAIEVGNIFRLGTKYSEALNVKFLDKDGTEKFPYMASYGIGPSRIMGTIVEVSHDERGIIWPENLAPYQIHIVNLGENSYEPAQKLYEQLKSAGKDVLWDDRSESAGVKLGDCDLIGIPTRLVISDKTLAENKIEVKSRHSGEIELLEVNQILNL